MRARLACLCTVFSCGLVFAAIALPTQAAAPSVQELVTKLSDKDLQARLDAAQALKALGPGAAPAIKALTGLLAGDSTMLRWAAIDALGAIGSDAQTAVPALRPLLEDSSADIRRSTIRALAAIGHDDKIGAELTVAMEDEDWLVQKAAVDAFIQLKRTDAAAIPPLVSALQSSEAPLRIVAAQALGQYGPAAGTAVSPLIQSLRDGNPDVEIAVMQSLVKIGSVSDRLLAELDRLSQADSTRTDEVVAAAKAAATALRAKQLPQQSGDVAEQVRLLTKRLHDGDWHTRLNSAVSLGDLGSQAAAAVSDLSGTTTDAESVVRWAAVEALGKIGSNAKSAVPALIKALDDRDGDVRRAAAAALGHVGAAAGVIAALGQATRDSDWLVRLAAVQSLQGYGAAAKGALDDLKRLQNDKVVPVRDAVGAALSAIAA